MLAHGEFPLGCATLALRTGECAKSPKKVEDAGDGWSAATMRQNDWGSAQPAIVTRGMTETADRWRRVEAICQSALDRPPSQRAAYVRTACGEDTELRGEVEQLLTHESTAERFLAGLITDAATGVLSASRHLLSGQVFNGLEVQELIGAGGMGEVYRARDTKLRRDVAIKVLPTHLARDPERMARFQREAEVLASLNHPYIAQVYGLENSDDVLALVLELVEGPTLADRILEHSLPSMKHPHRSANRRGIGGAHAQGSSTATSSPRISRCAPTAQMIRTGLAKFHARRGRCARCSSTPVVTATLVDARGFAHQDEPHSGHTGLHGSGTGARAPCRQTC